MALELQKYLREHGLEKTVEDLKLIHKIKGNLNLFKYNQIESDYSIRAVQEARGLILDSSKNWDIVCYTFHKFFNYQEGFAHPLDWESVEVFEKLDGSIIQMYFYDNEWHVATSGTIDANTTSNDGLITFQDLVWKTIEKCYNLTKEQFTNNLNIDYCYAFELCTPFNLVITQHKDFKIHLLGLRNKITLQEETIHQLQFDWLLRPKTFSLKSIDEINATLQGKDWQDEGYVALDQYFNRQKIKNPAYVAVHHLKGNLGAHHVMQVVKDNELSEFCVYSPERKEEIYMLKDGYDQMYKMLSELYLSLKFQEQYSQKEFALDVLDKVKRTEFKGLMFGLRRGLYPTVREWLYKQDNKFLYMYITDHVSKLF